MLNVDIGVTEHLGHVLDAHTISETHRGRICKYQMKNAPHTN